MALGLGLIIAIILFKYKPTYVVSLCGEQIGYVSNATELQNRIQSEIIDMDGENIDFVTLDNMPKYELKLVEKILTTNEDEIMLALKDDAKVMYKYYAVILNDETITYVDNIEEAEEAVEQIKEEHKDDTIQLDLAVTANYTENIKEIGIQSVDIAKQEVEQKVDILIEEDEKTKLPSINGILLASLPVNGYVSSRFGNVSRIRSGAHTGTDIACAFGTKIKAVADGTVVFAQYNGSYGNLIKIDHGNGVETWYAHCNKLYSKVGDKISAGDIIAEVGMTGNTTGPHLHLEIRLNGIAINPQKYLYN